MNIPGQRVLLQDKYGRPSHRRRIILDDNCGMYACNNIANRYIIFHEFIKAMV
jgi:hypothetical protein